MPIRLARHLAGWAAGLATAAVVVTVGQLASSSTAAVATAGDENPPVAPGLVRWHGSFADAQAAAKVSGKPVLLFHMMGRLDKQFC